MHTSLDFSCGANSAPYFDFIDLPREIFNGRRSADGPCARGVLHRSHSSGIHGAAVVIQSHGASGSVARDSQVLPSAGFHNHVEIYWRKRGAAGVVSSGIKAIVVTVDI